MPSTTHGLPYPAGSSPTNVPGDMQALADAVDTLMLTPSLDAWTSYTPAWTGSGTPTIGNGTLAGSYRQVGKTVFYRIELTAGSTSTYGSGTWSFSVPVAMTAAVESALGSALAFDTSTNARTVLLVRASTSTTVTLLLAATGANVTNSAPYTWAAGDRVSISGTYQAV